MGDLRLQFLDELCDRLDEVGIEGNVIERDRFGRPYVNIWYGKFEDHDWHLSEMFTVVASYDGCYEIKPPNKYYDYFIDTFIACVSRQGGFYVMSSDQIIRTIKFLFNREKMEKRIRMKKENAMNKKMYRVSDMSFRSSPSQMDEITFTVNVLQSKCAIREDCERIIDAIESIGDTKEEPIMMKWEVRTPAPELPTYRAVDVIFNNPATIIIWADGTKTVVKAENEPFDPEKGLAMAISKKVLGNKYDYYDIFKKYVGRYEKKQKKGKKDKE